MNNRNFWIANILGLLGVYAGGLFFALKGQTGHWLVLLSIVILVAHLLEIPLAFMQLKARNPQSLRVVVLTFIFGLLWWVPARRGIFPVR
ncbi:MAG: hypothetical protein ACRES4_03030 [Nevskiales bacterium]